MEFDFVIIGSGPAGSVLSNELSNKGFKIALVDRAKNEKNLAINDFFCPYIYNCPSYYTPVYSNQLGGNSALWHSKIYLLSKEEIETYEWNIKYDELAKFSDDLAQKFNLDENLIRKFTPNETNSIYRYSLRAKFRNLYNYLRINENKNVVLFKGYSPIKLNMDKDKVKSIEIKNEENLNKTINLNNALIFCAGGLGNPHLLLNLLPEKNELIGKNLSDHPHVNLGKIIEKKFTKYVKIAKPNIKDNLKIKKSDEIALVNKRNNFFSGIQLDYKTDPIRSLRRLFIKIQNTNVRKFLSVFSFLITKVNGLYFKLGHLTGKYYKYSFEFFFSQKPSMSNRVDLSSEVDKFGLKKINIDWNIRQDDMKNYNNLINYVLGENGKLLKTNEKINFMKSFYKNGLSGLHPSCTTKIGLNSKVGVVDKDLKLFNYENVFINGSSVFPYNGYTNPTWTIMTLSLRLSDRLGKLYFK